MKILCDKNNIVKSRASHIENLGEKSTDDVVRESGEDIRVGDTFDGTKHTINTKLRAEKELESTMFDWIENSIRKKECAVLGVTQTIPTSVKDTYDDKDTALKTKITSLEALIK